MTKKNLEELNAEELQPAATFEEPGSTELTSAEPDEQAILPEGEENSAPTEPEPETPKKHKASKKAEPVISPDIDQIAAPPEPDAGDAAENVESDLGSGQESETDSDDEPEPMPRAVAARRRTVHVLDGGQSELTDAARRRSDLIDLSESLKSRRVMTGVIAGIERPTEDSIMSYAVVYHGAFKIIIPAAELVDIEDGADADYIAGLVTRRLGAEIDYLVKGIDAPNNVAAGSRVEAMRVRRRNYYYQLDRDGEYLIQPGDRGEARVVSVIRSGIFVELFGAECFIPLNELSYLRWVDAAQHFKPGDRTLVKIIELDRPEVRGNYGIQLELSVKQANESNLRKALERFVIGNIYVGVVTMISPSGIFVSFDDVPCLCKFPARGRPAVGTPVTVKLLGVNLDDQQIWGVILH